MKTYFYREAQFESTFQISIIFFGLLWTPADDLNIKQKWWQTSMAIASLCSSFFTISKAGIENLLTFGEENKMANIPLWQQLKMIARFSPVFILTTFFCAGCLGSTTMAAMALASIPASMLLHFLFLSSFNTAPVVVFVLLKWLEVTLDDLVQSVWKGWEGEEQEATTPSHRV